MDWSKIKVAIVAARWNSFVTDEMKEGAVTALKSKGVPEDNIELFHCPGSYELPLACKYALDILDVDGVVAIGAVIEGGTPHFHYVCDAVNRGISELNTKYNKPIAFGVLTTNTVEQAVERSGLNKGNKGAEAALAMCDMLELKWQMKKLNSKRA